MSFALGSPQKCNALFQPDSVMQNIDEDVEKMNFKLISVENSIRKMLAERQVTVNESHESLLAKLAKSRHETEAVAAKLLLSRQNQQDKRIRLRLKRYMEQESILINDVAVPDLKLSDKSAALVNASQKKMFEKKIQLVKLCNELKTMNLQSVVKEIKNAKVKAKYIEEKRIKAAVVNQVSSSPTKLAWAVQSPRIIPRMPQGAIISGPKDNSLGTPNNTFMTAIPPGHSLLSIPSLTQSPKKESHDFDTAKKSERTRNYSILTDMDIPSRALDHETEMISDCSKGSRKYVTRKWQLLKILDELK